MKWEKVKLGDIATFSNGINFNKTAYAKGIKLIGVSNFGDRFYPDYSQLQEVKKDIVRLEDCLRNGDIVFVRSNGNKELVGRCMLVKNPTERVTYSGFCIRARLNDTDRYDPVYFTYYFKSKAFRRAVSGTAVGANIQNLSQARLSNHDCNVPDIETQHRIADILSAYDDLIENNQKQIKLLEEAAQRLYKEWFVDLRFPGHENTKIVDGVPEGWNWCKLEDAIQLDPKVTLTKERMKQFIPMSALSTSSMVLDESQFTETTSNSGSKFQNGDTLLARITPCLENGKTAYVSGLKSDEGAVGSTEYIVMRAKTINSYMVYLLARTDDFRQSAINSMSGSDGRQRVKSDKLKMLDYLHPTSELVEKFENVEEPIFEKIYRLSKQIQQAKQARDLLLPKLMSGEVEV